MNVAYSLIIENDADIPAIFYKDDVGGNNNCIVLKVRVYPHDANNIEALGSLRLTLYYHLIIQQVVKRSKVTDQSILSILTPVNELYINQDGHCEIRCKITQVSQKHEKRLFCIGISLGSLPEVYCRPITVMAKSTKKIDAMTIQQALQTADNIDGNAEPIQDSVDPTIIKLYDNVNVRGLLQEFKSILLKMKWTMLGRDKEDSTLIFSLPVYPNDMISDILGRTVHLQSYLLDENDASLLTEFTSRVESLRWENDESNPGRFIITNPNNTIDYIIELIFGKLTDVSISQDSV